MNGGMQYSFIQQIIKHIIIFHRTSMPDKTKLIGCDIAVATVHGQLGKQCQQIGIQSSVIPFFNAKSLTDLISCDKSHTIAFFNDTIRVFFQFLQCFIPIGGIQSDQISDPNAMNIEKTDKLFHSILFLNVFLNGKNGFFR